MKGAEKNVCQINFLDAKIFYEEWVKVKNRLSHQQYIFFSTFHGFYHIWRHFSEPFVIDDHSSQFFFPETSGEAGEWVAF